jgi:hypothetical protein
MRSPSGDTKVAYGSRQRRVGVDTVSVGRSADAGTADNAAETEDETLVCLVVRLNWNN